ncbi:MAG: trypsin-like peptidase domain-containing protein [Candidatus Didemnitutus sp.]|nr:trypsin-like peptidase domain-containing protein [Candidatus Didemnitutus sp.]
MKLSVSAFLLVACSLCAAPNPPGDVVFKPTFLTGYDSLTAGTGFLVRIDGAPVFVTAHHLFGPAAGLERDLSPTEAKNFVSALAASSMDHPSLILVSSEMMFIPAAKAFDQRDAAHDIAAFRLSNYHGATLVISAVSPKVGEKVYLLARPRGEQELRLLSAVVSRVGKASIEYSYDQSGMNLAGTSGAPILNDKGEVVAINLGGGDLKGKVFGFGNPSTSFVALLSNAQ